MRMYKSLLSDFSRVLLKPRDTTYQAGLNALHKKIKEEQGESYDIFEHFELNEELLNFYQSIKRKCTLNLFTTDVIQNEPKVREKLEQIFENIFAANDYDISKTEPSAYRFIADKINLDPVLIIYVDDQKANVSAAREAGLQAIQYKDDDHALIEQIKGLLEA